MGAHAAEQAQPSDSGNVFAVEGHPIVAALVARFNRLANEQCERVHRAREEAARKAVQERQALLAEAKQRIDELEVEMARIRRLTEYCENCALYFRKTWFGFGRWVEENERDGTATPVEDFDVNNQITNRIMALQAAGWGNKIPAGTAASGDGHHRLFDVLC